MKRALAVNAALVAAAVAASAPWPGELRLLGAALVVLAIPGVAWLGAFRGAPLTPARCALAVTGVSCASAVAGLAVGSWFAAPHAAPFLIWTALVVNAGLAFAGPRPRFDARARWGFLGAVAAAGFAVTAAAAIHLVPPLEDHDMEVRGTAYGLAADLKPYFTSNREVYLPMSHPVLFNVLVAQSLVVTGEIDAVRPSYDSAKRAEAAAGRGERFDWEGAWRADYRAFLDRPARSGTRAPSVYFAALLLALLADLLLRATGSGWAAAAGAFLYATAPETIVRSAYAGYFSETVFAMLLATILLTEDEGGGTSWVAAAGALMALLDHKTVVLALAVASWYGGRALVRRERPDRRAVALVAGFGAGTLVWWAYGFWVNARVFVNDHLRKHLVHRFLLNDVRFVPDHLNRYAPSIPELWREFAAHTGWALVPVSAAASAWALARRSSSNLAVLALWCLAGALVYSLTDWRQTKHLMNGLAPMVILAVAWSWPPTGWRRAAQALLLAGALVNLRTDLRLLADFTSLRVSGASDIDGW